MEVVNKKLVLVVIMIGIFCTFFIWQNISDNKTQLEEVSLKNNKVDSSMFAIMLEQEDEEGNSTYVESTDNVWPTGYKYNSTMSGCLDQNGTNIPDILSYDTKTQKAIVKTKGVAYCYLYFDIDKSVYGKVVSDYNNSNGVSKTSSASAETGNTYDVYYYTGNITNNNILYGDYCWKMVRTTETGGVKLIYNGVPTEAEDGTKTCNNTGSASQLSSTKSFNSSNNSPAYVGYMYNTVYKYNSTSFTTSTNVLSSSYMSSSSYYTYYYGDEAVWNETTQQYDLKLSDGADVTETTTWSSSTYSSLVGKYTCRNTTATSCATIYYIAEVAPGAMYYYALTNNRTKDDYKIKLATSVTDNGDGTYTLVDPVEVSKAEYGANYANYKNYYYCNDLTSETCGTNNTIMFYSISTSTTSLAGLKRTPYKYGNSFTYENGTYKLVDTKEVWNWNNDYNKLNSNHYTCFNTSGECTEMKYIYYTSGSTAYYITLKDGKTVEIAINEMLYAEDVNKADSTIKDYIDTWYEGAILNQTDGNGVLYSSYLENTIFCNNRATTNLSASGWNPNGGSTSTYLNFNNKSLECENKTDQFTLKVEAGGTEGYGNNALDYPIGLISYKEADLATGTGYLKSGSSYWLLSPEEFTFSRADVNLKVSGDYFDNGYFVDAALGVRPAVSLSNNVEITGGAGSVDAPYKVIFSN